uniref:Zinc finger C3HC4 RING-type domain-containing protein n=1 Tax=Phasianus colchicus TaxID=9054 RepID=A0A669QBX8_PHACC
KKKKIKCSSLIFISYGSEEMGNASQLQQAEACQASHSRCPICLDAICDAAHVPTCFHCFCFSCIWQWAIEGLGNHQPN